MSELNNCVLKDYSGREYEDLKLVRKVCVQNAGDSYIKGIAYMVDAKEIITKILLQDGVRIGLGIIMEDVYKGYYELRYCILEEFQNKGYGTVLLGLLKDYVEHNIPNSKGCILSIDDHNTPSIYVAKKNGFSQENGNFDYVVHYQREVEKETSRQL